MTSWSAYIQLMNWITSEIDVSFIFETVKWRQQFMLFRVRGNTKMNALIIALFAIIGSTVFVDAQYQTPRKLVCVYNSTSFQREGQYCIWFTFVFIIAVFVVVVVVVRSDLKFKNLEFTISLQKKKTYLNKILWIKWNRKNFSRAQFIAIGNGKRG